MEIMVRVTPNARVPSIVKVDEATYRVKVDARAAEGKANERLVELLAGHFKVAKSRVRILKGVKGRDKAVEIG